MNSIKTIFQLYKNIFSQDKLNLPALFFLGVGLLGTVTMISSFITDFLIFPFLLLSTIASFFAVWYLNILGSLTEQVDKLETTVESLKSSNDKLHNELTSLENLRQNLERYAKENQDDFEKVLNDINSSFKRLENITKSNEQVLIARVAQDLEFMDAQVGMQREEYERFVQRIPNHLQNKFEKLGYASFDKIAGEDKIVDYKEIKTIVQSLTT